MSNAEHINRLNEAIQELQNILQESKAEEISQLEIDLSLDKIKRLYDIVLKLKAGTKVEVEPKPEKIEKLEEMPETKTLDLEVVPVVDIEEAIQEMESPLDDIETDEILIPVQEEEVEPEKIETTEVELEVENEAVSEVESEKEEEIKAGDVLDLFNDTQNSEEISVHEDVGEEQIEKETIADKLQKSKLETIKSAIGINEKFFFLNELFSGDLQTYNDNIEKLDSKNTLNEALAFLNEMAEEFNWNIESEAVVQISQMLENKFS